MNKLKRIFSIILCLTLIFCSVPITTFAADSIDVAPEYPVDGFVKISKDGIKNTYGQKYDNLRDQFVIDLTKNPVDLSTSEQIEFDIYIENSKTFKTIYQDRVLCFNISSSATNKMLERTNYMFITQITQDGWNHIEIPVKATATDLTNVTYVYLSSGGGTTNNPLANKYLRIANICTFVDPFDLTLNGILENKYEYGNPITVTVRGNKKDTVNIYKAGKNTPYYTYTVADVGFGVEHNIIDLIKLPVGKYTISIIKEGATKAVETHEINVINQRKLRIPDSATYELKNDTDGFAEGTITVNVDIEKNNATDIIPYLANEDGILEGYSSLYAFRVTGETTVFEVEPGIIIPKGATKLRLYAQYAEDYTDIVNNTATITEDYIEIDLPEGAASQEDWGELITEFQVVSDTHINAKGSFDNYYTQMLKDIVKLSPNSTGLFINGDRVDSGSVEEYEKQKKLHASVKGAPNYYSSIGNHEYYNCGYANQAAAVQRFISYSCLPDGTKPDSQHYDFWLNGYHYVILGNDNITSDLLSATFTDETMTWLRATLEEDRSEGRPVFIFNHFPIQGTVAGSLGESTKGAFTGIWGANATKIKAVLKDFPEAVLFSSHQHIPLGYPSTMYQRDEYLPTIFNTSTASMPWIIRDRVKYQTYGCEGYYIYVYEDKVIVRGRDFANGTWIPSAQFYVDYTDGTGAATKQVTFNNSGRGPAIEPVTVATGSKITAPSVSDGDYVVESWFTDASLTTKFYFSTYITEDITLYAKWVHTNHTFENDICTECGAPYVCEHKYSNACDKSCNKCGETRTTSHSYKSVITKATLTKNGKKQYKCTVCGYVSSKSSTIYRPYSFKLSTTSYTYNGKVKKPTVTVKDSAGKKISSSNYTVTYASGRKNVGKYKVTIKMKGNYSGTKTLYFKINPAKTTVKSLTAGTKSLKVSITKKTAQVTGYQIYCSTSKSFSSNVTKKYITSYKTTSTTLKGLKAKKTYYVKVRTYKTVGGVKYYSGWSTVKYKKTK